ncbi:hypothetical protein E4U33_002001 [Claviceps sp. LM78 group G4]|nr:hypothetical protein E4U33_002001 [Claviceps sp. LM78 group G4]
MEEPKTCPYFDPLNYTRGRQPYSACIVVAAVVKQCIAEFEHFHRSNLIQAHAETYVPDDTCSDIGPGCRPIYVPLMSRSCIPRELAHVLCQPVSNLLTKMDLLSCWHFRTKRYRGPKKREPLYKHEEEQVYPIHCLDQPTTAKQSLRTWVMCFNDVLIAPKLHEALCHLLEIGDWKKLGTRLRVRVSTS